MNRTSWLLLILCLLLPCVTEVKAFSGEDNYSRDLHADGPYIWHDSLGTGARIVTVTPEGQLQDQHVATLAPGYQFKVRTEDGRHQFDVRLHEVSRPSARYEPASKIFVMSDPHGNFDCFQSLLRAAGVIDENYHWSFADGHLVIIGDVMDRGVDVTTIFWLIYQLEAEASTAGGHVSFLLGNHEPMVLMSDNRYTEDKYLALADTLHLPCGMLYGPRTELGRWLMTRNTMMRIGRNLFVHAGLSPKLYEMNLPIETINEEISRGLYLRKKERKQLSQQVYDLFASDGPIWYRGLVKKKAKYHPAPADSLDMILARYDADRLYVGHTIFKQVSKFYKGKVVGVNVNNMKARKSLKPRGVLITPSSAILVTDKGLTKKHIR